MWLQETFIVDVHIYVTHLILLNKSNFLKRIKLMKKFIPPLITKTINHLISLKYFIFRETLNVNCKANFNICFIILRKTVYLFILLSYQSLKKKWKLFFFVECYLWISNNHWAGCLNEDSVFFFSLFMYLLLLFFMVTSFQRLPLTKLVDVIL